MTYSSGDVYDVTGTKARVSIPDIPTSEIGNEFIIAVRNLDTTLFVDLWTLCASEVKHRIPPNYDGILLESLPYEHIKDGLNAQVTTAGTAQLNIDIYSKSGRNVDTEINQQTVFADPAIIPDSEQETPDEREVVSVIV
jgi:hypothetical protein